MTTSELGLIVCGARNWTDRDLVYAKLDAFLAEHPRFTLIEGEAAGVDRTAGAWAKREAAFCVDSAITHLPMPADWRQHAPNFCPGQWCVSTKDYCIGAGFFRNQQMIDKALEFEEQYVLAFKDNFRKSKSHGTEDLVDRAQAAGIHGLVIHH